MAVDVCQAIRVEVDVVQLWNSPCIGEANENPLVIGINYSYGNCDGISHVPGSTQVLG